MKLFLTCVTLTALTGLSNCARTVSDTSPCAAYAEARLSMPTDPEALPDNWLKYIAESDTRMTAICR